MISEHWNKDGNERFKGRKWQLICISQSKLLVGFVYTASQAVCVAPVSIIGVANCMCGLGLFSFHSVGKVLFFKQVAWLTLHTLIIVKKFEYMIFTLEKCFSV